MVVYSFYLIICKVLLTPHVSTPPHVVLHRMIWSVIWGYDNVHDFNHLEQKVGPAVAVHGVALVAVVLLLGISAPSDHKAALLSRPRLQGALSEQQLELARGEGVQKSRVGEVVIILDVVNNLGAQQ